MVDDECHSFVLGGGAYGKFLLEIPKPTRIVLVSGRLNFFSKINFLGTPIKSNYDRETKIYASVMGIKTLNSASNILRRVNRMMWGDELIGKNLHYKQTDRNIYFNQSTSFYNFTY